MFQGSHANLSPTPGWGHGKVGDIRARVLQWRMDPPGTAHNVTYSDTIFE